MNHQAAIKDAIDRAFNVPELQQFDAGMSAAAEAVAPKLRWEQAIQSRVFGDSLKFSLLLALLWLLGGAVVSLEPLLNVDIDVPRRAGLALYALTGLVLGATSIAVVIHRRKKGASGPELRSLVRKLAEFDAFQREFYAKLAKIDNRLLDAQFQARVQEFDLRRQLNEVTALHLSVPALALLKPEEPVRGLDDVALAKKAEASLQGLHDRSAVQALGQRLEAEAVTVQNGLDSLLKAGKQSNEDRLSIYRRQISAENLADEECSIEIRAILEHSQALTSWIKGELAKCLDRTLSFTPYGKLSLTKETEITFDELTRLKKTRDLMLGVTLGVAGVLPILLSLSYLVYAVFTSSGDLRQAFGLS